MEEVLLSKEKNIKDLIYEIRGHQVMLDSDLAMLYECKNGTKEINQAVKNNPNKFPERYSWLISSDEYNYACSKSKFLTLNKSGNKRGSNIKYNHRVFTEEGVAMLATILKTKVATEVSIRIMDTFVAMRHYINANLIEQKYINKLVLEDHEKLELIFSRFDKDNEYLYLSGQVYDAYSKVLDIFKESKSELIIVDAYADKSLLDIIKKLKVKVIIITKKDNLLNKNLIDKYNEQYSNLKVIYDNTFHDRYFIIDRKDIYHCGASINKLGYRTFSINKIEDEIIKETLLNNIRSICE